MLRCNKTFKTLSIIILLVVLSASNVFSYKFGKIEDEHWQLGPPADYPEANAIIIFSKGKMTVKYDKISTDYHVRIKILTKEGIEDVSEMSFYYYKKDKLKNFKAHTIAPDGKKHKVEKDAIFEKTINYWKEKTFSFPLLEPGCIVEYKYTINSEYFGIIEPWYFQNKIYTLNSQFIVSITTGWAYDYFCSNMKPSKKRPKVEERPDPHGINMRKIKDFTWELENLPPVKDEPYMSSKNDYRSSLKFQIVSYTYPSSGNVHYFVESWQDLGDQLEKSFDEYCNKRKDIKKIAEKITKNLTTDTEKSKALFDYVKNEYISTNKSYSRYYDHKKISKLLEEKSGTSVEKNILLTELHKAIGLQSWPVYISTRSNSKFSPKNPYLRQFNYIICFVQIGNTWKFLDVFNRNSIYSILSPQCLTDGGFLIDGVNSSLVKMTINEIDSYRIDTTRIYINKEGHAICSTICSFGGYYASNYANKYDKNTPDDFIEKYFEDRLEVPCEISDYKCELDSNNNFTISVNYETDDLVKILDENILITPVSLSYKSNTFKSNKRFFPIDFTYPFTYQNTCEIYFDGIPSEIILPEEVIHEINGAGVYFSSEIKDSVIFVTQKLVINKPLFKPTFYKKVKGLFEKLSLFSENNVTIILDDIQ